jgi:pyruvate dehydrogenase complex dehydrogenase (E1) component
VSALHQFAKRGTISADLVAKAILHYGIDSEAAPSGDR